MNRLEEALRRAQRNTELPESFATPNAEAFDHFSAGNTAKDVEKDTAPPVGPAGPSPVVEAVDRKALDIPRTSPAGELEPAPTRGLGHRNGKSYVGKLVTSGVKVVAVEQYRKLAAALHYAQCEDGTKVAMVASALAGEGKTLTAVNLALTLSESYGRRVLLIDADFRRPTLHEVFQVPNVSGLNEGLAAETDRKLTLIEISPRLALLPAGKPNPDPMSGLTSDRMRRIIEEASTMFDWVLLDTPPVGLLTDAHLLAAMVNIAVLVVKAGRTPYQAIQRAIERVGRKRIIGVVLNCVEDRATSAEGQYDYYYADGQTRPGTSVHGA